MRDTSERATVPSTHIQKILPYRRQAALVNAWLKERLDSVLPRIMRREAFDMWVVACREYNEDPVFLSLMPEPAMYAGRLTILVFVLEKDGSVSRFAVARGKAGGGLYESVWEDGADQWLMVKKLVEERQPLTIGVNFSETFAFGDGLSSTIYRDMKEKLGDYASRFKSAERLAIGWLETRTESELAAYEGIVAIAHDVVLEAFSDHVLHPGITTNTDLAWWIRQRFEDFGLKPWFQPTLTIQRRGFAEGQAGGPNQVETVIMPGDLLHCDSGIRYLRLCTDNQQHAYVLRRGEDDAPEGLKSALNAGIRLHDIIAAEMAAGGTGNEILRRSREKAIGEGLVPLVYCHAIGYHGHGAGPLIGLTNQQSDIPGRGDYELFDSTCYALEANVTCEIPEWDNQKVRIALEQSVAVKDGKTWFMDGRQKKLHLI